MADQQVHIFLAAAGSGSRPFSCLKNKMAIVIP
jgi:hypothetical protein